MSEESTGRPADEQPASQAYEPPRIDDIPADSPAVTAAGTQGSEIAIVLG
jgi:hypothetical protein